MSASWKLLRVLKVNFLLASHWCTVLEGQQSVMPMPLVLLGAD